MIQDRYFAGNPVSLQTSRSAMRPNPPRWFGSWCVGQLVPIFATSSIMPGDTFAIDFSSVVRSINPVFPVMDDMEITVEAYFVPHRVVMSRKSMSPDLNDSNHSWSAFIGAQDALLNMPTPGDVKLPVVHLSPTSFKVGGLADCLGFHKPSTLVIYPNALKFLAYYNIWNEYFREPNTLNPVTYSITTSNGRDLVNFHGVDAGIDPSAYSPYAVFRFPLAPVSRYHGYFGSALPWPQRNSTEIDFLQGLAPVRPFSDESLESGDNVDSVLYYRQIGSGSTVGNLVTNSGLRTGSSGQLGAYSNPATSSVGSIVPSNLWADLSEATAATVNQFRMAVQTQRWYENLARSGNKYSDLVHGMFGVRGNTLSDKAEYLGGVTCPIMVSQVAQTTSDSSGNGLGKVGAFSLSNPSGFLFRKSFTEHGTLMIVMCCRVRDSFTQGIQREDMRSERFDFYWPQFANIGEQPILKRELFSGASTDEDVFGYQEAWAEYRMFVDSVTGYLNPAVTGSIKGASFANVFASAPTLKSFLSAEGQIANVDETLEVKSTASGFQLYGSFEFHIDMVRPMPLYSIPGLVDHH